MASAGEGGRLLQRGKLRDQPRNCRSPPAQRCGSGLLLEGRMGSLESYKMTEDTISSLINPPPRMLGWVALALRVVLAGLFVLAGALKLLDPAAFALEISRYQLIPWW